MTDLAKPHSQADVIRVICAYWLVSISMVYLNKVLLSNDTLKAPLFITMFQCGVSCLICIALGRAGEAYRQQQGKDAASLSFTAEWPRISISLRTALSVLPLSLIFVGMVGFNNLCLQFVEVSFYNIARSLSLVFNVILSYLLLGKSTSLNVCATLLFVLLGFAVGIDGEVNFSLLGTSFGVLSSLFVSLSFIYTAKVLPLVNNDKSLLIFYNNLNAVLLLVPLVLVFEARSIMANIETLMSFTYWVGMVLASGLGFSVALVTVLQIKFTSPLTHNISGTAKAAAQSLLAFYLWGNPVTFLSLLGLLMVLLASALYAVVVMRESAAASATQSGGPDKDKDKEANDAEKDEERQVDAAAPLLKVAK